MNEKLLESVMRDCPICDQMHNVEKWESDSEAVIKDTVVQYREVFFRCTNSDDEENEFVPGGLMSENLLRARDAYRRQKKLLTSSEIADIRSKYGLTQSDFAFLMGWGEVTVTRYESKTIQDETYDEMMRLVNLNPLFALQNLERHKDNFPESKYASIHDRILNIIENSNNAYLKQQEMISLYVRFQQASEFNGNKLLDLNMLNNVVGYFADNVPNLYKVKLMKHLWYADTLSYKQSGEAITGLVYQHKPYGALPIGYNELIYLPSVDFEEIQSKQGYFLYKITPTENIDPNIFTEQVRRILDFVIEKFKNFSTPQIVEYMHEETAYKETVDNQPISFSFAQQIDENRVIGERELDEVDFGFIDF